MEMKATRLELEKNATKKSISYQQMRQDQKETKISEEVTDKYVVMI